MTQTKKKTILIAHNYISESFSGASFYLAQYLSKNNYEVIFISHKPKLDFFVDKSGVIVYSWPSKYRPVTFQDFVFYAKIFLKHKPKIVICHFGAVNISAIVSKILSFGKAKVYPYYHTLSEQISLDSKKEIKSKILKIRKKLVYFLFADKIICPSDYAVADLKNYFGITKGVKIVNPMVDRFSSTQKNLDLDNIVISYLGRVDISKGILDFVDVFIEKTAHNPNNNLKLNIAGKGNQVDLLNEKIKNSTNIKYVGGLHYSEIDDYIQKSDFIIVTSKKDNLPTVGLESLMNGVPLLLSNQTGLSLELVHDENCILFSPDKSGYSYVLDRIIDNEIDYIKLQKNAREIYNEKFSLEKYYQKILELIK